LYSASGEKMSEVAETCKMGIDTFDYYVTNHFPEYDNNSNDNIYVIFRNDNHPFVVFRRVVTVSSKLLYCCIGTSPCGLIKGRQQTISTTLIFRDPGAYSLNVLHYIMGSVRYRRLIVEYNYIQADLKKCGPALLIMLHMHQELNEEGKNNYEGVSEGKIEDDGHAMVLVGIRKDDANQPIFLLQNFWQKKLFVDVNQEYCCIHTTTVEPAFYSLSMLLKRTVTICFLKRLARIAFWNLRSCSNDPYMKCVNANQSLH
jgi:hypothetical protein